LVDMLATFASIAGQALPADAGPDSFNVLPALLGEKRALPVRDSLVLQSGNPKARALRQGQWKLIPAGGAAKGNTQARSQLYNLTDDIGETKDISAENPEMTQQMTALLHKLCENKRSRP
jgi:arylsulfatase A